MNTKFSFARGSHFLESYLWHAQNTKKRKRLLIVYPSEHSTSACPAMFSNFLEIQTIINFANTASTQILFLFTIFYQYRSKIGEHALQTFAIRVWNHRFARFGRMRHYVKCFSSLYGFHCSSITRHSKHYFPQFPLTIEVTNSFGVLRCIYQQLYCSRR